MLTASLLACGRDKIFLFKRKMRSKFSVRPAALPAGNVGLLQSIANSATPWHCKVFWRLVPGGVHMYRQRECGLTRPYAPRRGGSKTAPSRTNVITLLAAAATAVLASRVLLPPLLPQPCVFAGKARACRARGTLPVVVVVRRPAPPLLDP